MSFSRNGPIKRKDSDHNRRMFAILKETASQVAYGWNFKKINTKILDRVVQTLAENLSTYKREKVKRKGSGNLTVVLLTF